MLTIFMTHVDHSCALEMDGLYSYFRSVVLGSPNDHQERYGHTERRPEQTYKPIVNLKKQHRYFTGIVTSLNKESGTGMIDKNVFFEFDAVIGGLRPAVGVSVHVSASREHVHAGWRAERVEITSKWQPESKSEVEVVMGFVCRMSGGVGLIDCATQEMMFSTEEVVSYNGYRPHINDWVKVSLLHQDEETVINEIQPLRSRTVTGTISSVSHGFGTINSDIYFTFSSCCNGYRPSRGDAVSIECVEYKHQKSNWRAFKVEPTTASQRVTSVHVSSNGSTLPTVPIIGTGKYIQLGDQSNKTTETNITPQETTRPYNSTYSTRNKSSTNLRGDYHSKLAACRVPGQRPLRPHPLRLSNRLNFFPVPDYLRAYVKEERMDEIVITEPSLGEPLCMENYQDCFSTLLYLEEIQREIDIRQFDMCSVSLRRCGPFLSLCVPGLAEGRPSLLVGDRIIVCEEGGDDTCPHWEGYIHEVRSGDILIKFADVFHDTYDNQDVDVMFAFNRTPLRRMHHVVRMCPSIGPNMLFPGQPSPKPPLLTLKAVQGRLKGPNPDQKWFNPALNSRQRAAVIRIVGAQCRPAPYILFGPPGTGKTVTLVEAILQIHRLSTGSRILACTPSNSAADLIAERLHLSGQLKQGEMVRLNAFQRSQTPPTCVKPHCMDTDSANVAIRSRIVIATCVTAGFLHSLGLGVGHFTHVFIDEAGQATEPESLLAISLLAETDGQLILTGDPCQLGPILSSGMAGSYGLGLSLLERLMERPAYQRDEAKFADHGSYDPLMVTKLVDNYRSHVLLLQLYSRMFYHNELQPKAPPSLTHIMDKWKELPNEGFPLIFHGVQGEDMQEGNSPSWFNPVEALQVAKYIQALKDNSTFAPMLEDIGVVTPYRKQVEKVRLLLQKIGAEEVKVGSVEEFQGQERTAIIISTVRSTTELLDFDVQHHLGFLSNPKRFNVAISRAQALLVVVGNPLLLSQDPYWSKLIQYAVNSGAYTGCPLPN